MKMNDLPSHRRPREKLLSRGKTALSDTELVAVLLRTGYPGVNALELAQRLLKQRTLAELLTMNPDQLTKLKGLGSHQATVLLAVAEIGERLKVQAAVKLTSPQTIVSLLQALTRYRQEHVVCLYADGRNNLLAQKTISIGTLTASLIHPRDVFWPAIEHQAASVVVVHNHPSGDPQPSQEDIFITEKLLEAGEVLDIPLLDHVIIGNDHHWISLKQELGW